MVCLCLKNKGSAVRFCLWPQMKKFINTNIIRKKIFETEKNFSSQEFWEKRYRNLGNSGSGSYGELAEFKNTILNDFVKKNNIKSVIDLGFGDGNLLKNSNYKLYYGFEVSEVAIEKNKNYFKNDTSKKFFNIKELKEKKADLSMSIDVLYHLVEDKVFEKHLEDLFRSATRFVIIYSSNFDSIYEEGSHVFHRKFTNLLEKKFNNFKLYKIIENPYPDLSSANFYLYRNIKTP